MTNTRITDPEILECRYPVILKSFSLRPGSGGKGTYCGGDGVIRELLFRASMTLSVLTERRVFAPYGSEGSFFPSYLLFCVLTAIIFMRFFNNKFYNNLHIYYNTFIHQFMKF